MTQSRADQLIDQGLAAFSVLGWLVLFVVGFRYLLPQDVTTNLIVDGKTVACTFQNK